jgi:hypothetical protein
MYFINPGESVIVEAAADAIGLKVGVVTWCSATTGGGGYIHFSKWKCKNDSTLKITDIDGEDVTTEGGNKIPI